jgi:tetratricopeptide (TPR) repeat protein
MKKILGPMLSLLLLLGSMSLWCQTQEQPDALKAQNAKATRMNTLITQVNAASITKNWADAIAPLQELSTLAPDNWQFLSSLGDAQLNTGKYQDAIQSYDKGINLAQAVVHGVTPNDPHKPWTDLAKAKTGISRMLVSEGNANLKLGKNSEAIAAYNKAAELDPNPAVAYFNLCAVEYNTGNMEGALAACDKAIHYDPSKADAYFIKGSALYSLGKLDAQGKYRVPTGTEEALLKYLELSPGGPHAEDVKAMLDALGNNIQTTKGGKK